MARYKLTSGNSTANLPRYTTASFTPGANRLQLAFVVNANTATATAPVPTAIGNGLTWTQVATVALGTSEDRRLTRFVLWARRRPPVL